jgi:hypothetical protein
MAGGNNVKYMRIAHVLRGRSTDHIQLGFGTTRKEKEELGFHVATSLLYIYVAPFVSGVMALEIEVANREASSFSFQRSFTAYRIRTTYASLSPLNLISREAASWSQIFRWFLFRLCDETNISVGSSVYVSLLYDSSSLYREALEN